MTAPPFRTRAEIAEAAARAEAATAGPWDDVISTWSVRALGSEQHGAYICDVNSLDGGIETDPHEPRKPHPGNKAFIAAARTDVPRLLATIAARDRTIERILEAGESMRRAHDAFQDDASTANADALGRALAAWDDRQRDARALLDGLRGRR